MLTPAQIGKLRDAIRQDFTLRELEQVLGTRLSIKRSLDDFSPGSDIGFQAYTMIRDSDRKGWDLELINALIAERPKNDLFLQIAFDLGISMNVYDNTSQAKLNRSTLEALVNEDPVFDPSQILLGISKNKRCVCRIQVSYDGVNSWGTGFLVGPDKLISNYHVFERVIKNPAAATGVTCKFDYEVAANGTQLNPGISLGLTANNPILAYSEYGTSDTTFGIADIDSVEWPSDKLDYALVKLEREIGNEAFGPSAEEVVLSGPKQEARGWITAPQNAPDLSAGKHMFIFQHPNKKPMKIAIGLSKVEGCDKNGNRVRYMINTEGGSSGSPCFDHKFNWSAVHNMGDPDWHNPYNQGIPAVKIIADLKQKGIIL